MRTHPATWRPLWFVPIGSKSVILTNHYKVWHHGCIRNAYNGSDVMLPQRVEMVQECTDPRVKSVWRRLSLEQDYKPWPLLLPFTLNISIFVIHWNVGYTHDTIKGWQWPAVTLFLRSHFSVLILWIYPSKLITTSRNSSWFHTLFLLCKTIYQCEAPILRPGLGKIAISSELFWCEYWYKIYVEWLT